MWIALLVIFAFGTPLLLQYAATRYSWIDRVGVVTLCYIAGILVGNIPGTRIPEHFAEEMMKVLVPLSIPLLLFSSDFRIWKRLGLRLLLAFFGCVISVCIAALACTCLFRQAIPEAWQYAAMLIGVFVGTTANMNAVGISLGVSSEMFVVVNGVEMLFGGLYLLLLLSVAKPLFGKFLKTKDDHDFGMEFILDEKIHWKKLPVALLLSMIILALGVGISKLLIHDPSKEVAITATILLTITTLGIVGSLIPKIHALKGTFGTGNYLMLVFCVVVGSLADVSKIFGAAPALILFVFALMTLAIILHCLYCRVFGIDTDTFLISSTAGIQGPAFIAPVTKAIGHQSLIPVGLALALLGLALANYVGLGMSWVLRGT